MTFKKVRLTGLAVVIFALFVLPFSAQAETKVAVVDVQKLMAEAKAAKSIQEQLSERRESFQKEFSEHERKLRETEKDLGEARGTVSADEFKEKRQNFESELLETRKLVQKRRRGLEVAASEALNELRTEIVKIVAEMADKNEYDIVLSRQNVILAEKEMDITGEVMKKLNKKLKKIELEVDVK